MRVTRISEIEIAHHNRLLIRVGEERFDSIYRAALGVSWDETLGGLVAPAPREWSHLDWYRQIVAAVKSEYGQQLMVGPETVWKNIPADLRQAIERESENLRR